MRGLLAGVRRGPRSGGASESRGPGGSGEGCPGGGFAGVACRVPAGPVTGSGGAAAGPGEDAGAGAGAGAARADAGVPVHVLPGGGAADGGGPGHDSRVGAAGAAVRGCAPVQFRRVRLAGAASWSSTSTTSTRPCRGRSSGMSSGWPRAWRWPGGTTGSPPRPAARSLWRRPRVTAPRCAEFAEQPFLDVWYAHLDIEPALAQFRSQVKAKRFKAAEELLAKAHTSDSMKAVGKLTTMVDGQRRIISTRR